MQYDLLARVMSIHIIAILLAGHIRGVVIPFGETRFADMLEFLLFHGFVTLRFTCAKFLIRKIAPRKGHVEHAIEKPVIYVANIAD